MSSSPIQYPATSSPREACSPRKRRRLENHYDRDPLRPISLDNPNQNRAICGGFIDEEDSEDENYTLHLKHARDSNALKPQQLSCSTVGVGNELHKLQDIERPQEPNNDSGCEMLSSPPEGSSWAPLKDTSKACAPRTTLTARTSSSWSMKIGQRRKVQNVHYSEIVAQRSEIVPGRAQKSYYGIEVHALLDQSNALLEQSQPQSMDQPVASVEHAPGDTGVDKASSRTLLWTEKYRARKFTDLIGDERTHRSVLRWLKSWDPVVFPSQHALRSKLKTTSHRQDDNPSNERPHRKLLLLTGPPGLGKTTLAHVCARQAGYETHEINASDERTKDVVKNRIRDIVGTENVRSVDQGSKDKRKIARPVCVIVDEVDGVVSGAGGGTGGGGGGEGGFVKALMELLALDQRNASRTPMQGSGRKAKGDNFRLLRPLILICNDVYHPSLRLLRQGSAAEIIHVRKPALQTIIPRLCSIFEKEGVPADSDGVRTLCEVAWGVTNRKQGGKGANHGSGDGDIRGILVAGEWVAGKLRTAALVSAGASERLTRRWIEQNIVNDLAHGGGMAKTLGRSGARDIVERVFKHHAGFSNAAALATAVVGHKRDREDVYGRQAAIGVSEAAKRSAVQKLREMIEASGEEEKVMLGMLARLDSIVVAWLTNADCFSSYPTHPYQDTTHLTKPDAASGWLHFSSVCSHRVHAQQEWDLAPYLSYPVLAFHNLFASSNNALADAKKNVNPNDAASEEDTKHPLHTMRADAHSHEFYRANAAHLTQLHAQLSLPLQRSFRSHGSMATELIPYALRLLNPAVKPVLVAGTSSVRRGEERELVSRSVECMRAIGARFEKSKVDFGADEGSGEAAAPKNLAQAHINSGWVYRMEPPLDELGTYGTFEPAMPGWEGDAGRARYALRQVLSQTHASELKKAEGEARRRRAGTSLTQDPADKTQKEAVDAGEEARRKAKAAVKRDFFGRPIVAATAAGDAIAVSHRPNRAGGRYKGAIDPNAVRKPITMKELLDDT